MSSSAHYAGVSTFDLAGPTAAAGPGGYTNLEIKITIPLATASTATLTSLNISGPAGSNEQWTFGNALKSGQSNPQATPGIVVSPEAVAPGTLSQTFDAYFSPVIANINPNTGVSTLQQLANNTSLSIADTYTVTDSSGTQTPHSDSSATDSTLTVMVSGMAANLADPTPVLPTTIVGKYPGQVLPQTSDGDAHITINNLPSGASINAATAELSDVAGLYWNTNNPGGRAELSMSVSPATVINGIASETINFPPERHESGSSMTFRYQLNGSMDWYVTDIIVPGLATTAPTDPYTDPNLRDGGPIGSTAKAVDVSPYPNATPASDMVTYTDRFNQRQIVTLQSLIASHTYAIINLSDGTYPISQPLDITSGMILQGKSSKAILDFTMTGVPQGAINFDASHITLNNFAIKFQNAKVDFPDGNAAIISDEELGSQHSRVDLNVTNLTIDAPQLANPVPDGQNQNVYHAVQTIVMDNFDAGTIENNTIHGGSISVQFGPWQISGNQVLGAVQGASSFAAFGVTSGHDITIAGNTVSDADPSRYGNILRFFVATHSGYNLNIVGNSVSKNVGLIAPNPNAADPTGHPLNTPEEIAFENYQKIYEGSDSAIGVSSSSTTGDDRRVISIPTSILRYFDPGFSTSPPFNTTVSWALTILNGSSAGASIRVIQQYNQDAANPENTSFLLDSPLPTGSYDLDIEPAFLNLTVAGNSINTSGTVSTGLVLGSTIINAQIMGNTFIGDQSSEDSGDHLLQSQAIRVNPYIAFGNHSQYLLPIEYNSYNVITATISDNTIVNALGGVKMYIEADSANPTTSGRTYGFVNLTGNQFSYSYPNANVLSLGTVGDYSTQINNTGVIANSSATNFTDPRTISVTASSNTIEWIDGAILPSTNVVVNAAEVNGILYEANATPPLLTDLATLSTVPVPLGTVFNTIGVTVDNNTNAAIPSGFDDSGNNPTGNSVSANALGSLGGHVTWNGQSFNIGAPGVNNVDSLGGVGIKLPAGQYATMLILGASTFGDKPAQFTIFYTDGTSTTFTQEFSDWAGNQNGAGTTYPGESIAATMSNYNSAAGGKVSETRYLYGYRFTLDPTKTVSAMGVINNSNLKVVAIDLVKASSTVSDFGFEKVTVGSGASAYRYNPPGSPWTFVGDSGLTGNDSAFTSGSSKAPEGTQTAFVQIRGSFNQEINFAASGSYQVTFQSLQRENFNHGGQDFQVLIDGQIVGSAFKPSGLSYETDSTATFAVSAGIHTLTFQGLDSVGGDNTAFVDDIAVVAVPAQSPAVGIRVVESPGFVFPAPRSDIGTSGSGFDRYQFVPNLVDELLAPQGAGGEPWFLNDQPNRRPSSRFFTLTGA